MRIPKNKVKMTVDYENGELLIRIIDVAIPEATPVQEEDSADILALHDAYMTLINQRARMTEGAKRKIRKRLVNYSITDLYNAIENFSRDGWWMEHNAHRGIAWFFHSDDRIEQFLNLVPKEQEPQLLPLAEQRP